MNCPACGALLRADDSRCPACGATPAPRTEGALAPDLAKLPAARSRPERGLEAAGLRRREPAWKDEVRERLKHRRVRPAAPAVELPLFPEPETAGDAPPENPRPEPNREPQEDTRMPEPRIVHREPRRWTAPREGRTTDGALSPAAGVPEQPRVDALAPEVDDLPLRPAEQIPAAVTEGAPAEEPLAAPVGPRILDLAERAPLAEGPRWSQDAAAEVSAAEASATQEEPEPVERPALLLERVQAASLDAMAVAAVGAVVIYFAARAARVPVASLLPAWPYLAAFLGFFGLVYASFFTGLTGQTLGKMLFRLRVVDRAGAPPGHGRAALRALIGTAFSLVLVGVAPIFLDPARRALHDRLLRTRVVRI